MTTEIIKYLGDRLAERIGISPPAARGLIRLAIADELGPLTPLNQINFNDLKVVIEKSLKLRLKNLVQNIDLITNYMLNKLIKNQSLITMAKV